MLGDLTEAEDAVQECWLHLSRFDTSGVENLGGLLTAGVARACLDMLPLRKARRRVRGGATEPDADLTRSREVVDAFLAASRGGDFDALLAVLDPDVVFRADRAAVLAGAPGEVRGAPAVGRQFSGRAQGARPAL